MNFADMYKNFSISQLYFQFCRNCPFENTHICDKFFNFAYIDVVDPILYIIKN